jgi:hypothetical protein
MTKKTTIDEIFIEPTEAEEQRELFKWAKRQSGRHPELQYMYHVPNGGRRRTREAALLRAEGVKSGVPDIVLPAPKRPYHGLYIEMKRQKSGTVSEDQKKYLDFLNFAGYKAVVCHGWKEASDTIMNYLKGEK